MLIKFNLNPFYAPEGDIGANATEVVADLGTDEGAGADPFDSLSFSNDDDDKDEPEPEEEDVEKEEVLEEEKEEVKEEVVKEERTSKQTPEFDAVHARARRAEENAARLEKELSEHKETVRQEAEKKEQEQFKANLDGQWNTHLETAEKMRTAEYDEQIVTQWLDAQKMSLQAQEKNAALEQRLNQIEADNKRSQKEQERLQQEKSASEGRELLLKEHKALKTKYGELVPDVSNFEELIEKMGQEVLGKVANNGLSMEEAFRLVNFDKISQQEKSLVEKRTTANIVDRSKKTVETNKTEKKPEDTLTEGQKRFAKEFGVDPKEVAKRSNPLLFRKNKGVS